MYCTSTSMDIKECAVTCPLSVSAEEPSLVTIYHGVITLVSSGEERRN